MGDMTIKQVAKRTGLSVATLRQYRAIAKAGGHHSGPSSDLTKWRKVVYSSATVEAWMRQHRPEAAQPDLSFLED